MEEYFLQAYEFYATPENGVIPIHEHYKNLIIDDVMVIVPEIKLWQINREKMNTQRKTDFLSPPTLKTKGWKFNRDEVNER